MDELTIVTNSFDPRYSSCSDRVPRTFRWTTERSNIEVYTDDLIESGVMCDDSTKVKYGWLLESRGIVPKIHTKVLNPEYKAAFKNIFTCDRSLVKIDPTFFVEVFAGSNLPWCKPVDMPAKSSLCCMFCSPKLMCDGHVVRHQIAFKHRKFLDLFGGVFGSPRIGLNGTPHPVKDGIMEKYKFCLVVENAIYDNYFTEKLTDCFITKTVPIYVGSKSVAEYFDAGGIVEYTPNFDFSYLSDELYDSKLESINRNFNIVKNMKSSDEQIWQYVNK